MPFAGRECIFTYEVYIILIGRYQYLAGEHCESATLSWTEEKLGIPMVNYWWQTESGWPLLANMMSYDAHQVKSESATKPVCG